MKEEILKYIINKYYDIVENNIKSGHYVETDFRHYAELVQFVVENVKYDNIIFFTALGNSPFQWFNFNVENAKAKNVSDTKKMEADPVWTEYIKFNSLLAKNPNVNIHRCVFSVEDDLINRTCFTDLIEESKVKAQIETQIILQKDKELEPLAYDKIKQIIGDEFLGNKYACYKDIKKAYLIIDSNDESNINYDKNNYEAKRLWDHFGTFQPTGNLKRWTCTKLHAMPKALPEDFFLIGTGSCLEDAKWHFALGGDISKDHNKVRLWFVADNLHGKKKDTNGEYFETFKFDDLTNFVKNYVVKEMK